MRAATTHDRQFRCIDAGPVVHEEAGPAENYRIKEHRELVNGTRIYERYRDGDKMIISIEDCITVEGPLGDEEVISRRLVRVPGVIKFEDILRLVKVEPDDDCGMPWDDQDGWKHELQPIEEFEDAWMSRYENVEYADVVRAFHDTQGYCSSSRGDRKRVMVTDDSYCGESRASRIAYLRSKGASKQVAREVIAYEDRRYIAQIVAWRNDGYPCVYVTCEFEIGEEDTYEDSCGGFEEDYADEAKKEIAGHIASAMADDGYTIVDAPDNQAAYKANRLWHRKDQFRRNLHMFDVGRTE